MGKVALLLQGEDNISVVLQLVAKATLILTVAKMYPVKTLTVDNCKLHYMLLQINTKKYLSSNGAPQSDGALKKTEGRKSFTTGGYTRI